MNSSDREPIPVRRVGDDRRARQERAAIAGRSSPSRWQAGRSGSKACSASGCSATSPLAAEGSRYEIESVWLHDGRPVLKFRGIDTISDAEALVGAEVRLPAAERMPLEEGEFYQADLIGCEVVEQPSGESLGEVTGWQEAGGPNLLQVRMQAGASC